MNSMLDDLKYRSWSIRDLEAKVFKGGSEPLEYFGGNVKGANL